MENNEMNDKKEKAFDGGEKPKTEKQEKKGKKAKKKSMNGEKKFYLFTAISCAAVLLAIIIVAVLVTNSGAGAQTGGLSPITSDSSTGGENGGDDSNEPVITLPEGMISPVAAVSVGEDYGFHQSQTLGWYYVHEGVDFTAATGTEVLAADDGVVESIYKNDVLLGTEIVIAHEDGVKSVYRFVTETDDLKVGDRVRRGEVIATVAEPTGNEYKDGAHLHFEIMENGVSVDPTKYLTLEEK